MTSMTSNYDLISNYDLFLYGSEVLETNKCCSKMQLSGDGIESYHSAYMFADILTAVVERRLS